MSFFSHIGFGKKSTPEASDFSRFFREATSGEKKKVFMDVARKASAEQREIMQSVVRIKQPI